MCAPEPSISTKLCLFSLLWLQAKPSWGRAAPGCPPQHVPICPAMPPICHLCPSYLFIYLSLWISFCLDSCSLDALRGLRSGLGWFWGPGDGVGWPRGVPATCGSLPVQGHGDTGTQPCCGCKWGPGGGTSPCPSSAPSLSSPSAVPFWSCLTRMNGTANLAPTARGHFTSAIPVPRSTTPNKPPAAAPPARHSTSGPPASHRATSPRPAALLGPQKPQTEAQSFRP